MKKIELNYYSIALIFIITILILFSPIKTQENNQTKEKQLFNNSLIEFNKTEIQYQNLSEKMKNVKYDIFMKIRYRGIQKKHDNIQEKIEKIQSDLDSNTYNKKEILEEIKEINVKIEEFGNACNSAINSYYKSNITYNKLKKIIIAIFIALFIIINIVVVVGGIVSFYIIRKQKKKYVPLDEENSKDVIVMKEKKNNNNTFEQIRIRNEDTGESSESRIIKKKTEEKEDNDRESNNKTTEEK